MNIKQLIQVLPRLATYNFKIIFAGKFIWFFLSAFAFFLFFLFQVAWSNQGSINEEFVYELLLIPALLLVFYPAVFGIQNDDDARILELLFGIPDYKYKVWGFRLLMIYVAVFCILLFFSCTAFVLLYPTRPFAMTVQLMFPVLFYGSLSFMFSTFIRNGNGTAVLMIIISMILWIVTNIDAVSRSLWNVFLNPFDLPRNMIPAIWDGLILKNRVFLLAGSIIWIMVGLLNLRKREKFL
jgi:hypothetical protein